MGMDRLSKRRRYVYLDTPQVSAGPADYRHSTSYSSLRHEERHEESADISFVPLPIGASLPSATVTSGKRAYNQAFNNGLPLSQEYTTAFPSFYPQVPKRAERSVKTDAKNPFSDPYRKHPRLNSSVTRIAGNGCVVVNGFIKASFGPDFRTKQPSMVADINSAAAQQTTVDPSDLRLAIMSRTHPAPYLPPDFGGPYFLTDVDRALFRFFRTALCQGRTNVGSDNTYSTEIAPMAVISPLVQHAILALSATYMLDYRSSRALEDVAQVHHDMALTLLDQELAQRENYDSGKELALVAALTLLSHNEIINWESNTHDHNPKWYRSGKLAEYVLEKANPAYEYHKSENVQCTKARFALGQMFCLDNVMSDCLYPLDYDVERCGFKWLIDGDPKQKNKIVGITGLSPQLMHYFAKITFLSAQLCKKPNAPTSNNVAKEIERILRHFRQWSDISIGHDSAEELFASCSLVNDKVTTHAEVTDLIAESYVAAAQIYVQCRALRRPRKHPSVQEALQHLLKCVRWQPTSGDLFTAQTPLFAVFIAGTVSYRPEHRKEVRDWFEPICQGSRGNVKPAFEALERIWEWADEKEELGEGDSTIGEDMPFAVADPWWEAMVWSLTRHTGRLNLS